MGLLCLLCHVVMDKRVHEDARLLNLEDEVRGLRKKPERVFRLRVDTGDNDEREAKGEDGAHLEPPSRVNGVMSSLPRPEQAGFMKTPGRTRRGGRASGKYNDPV